MQAVQQDYENCIFSVFNMYKQLEESVFADTSLPKEGFVLWGPRG